MTFDELERALRTRAAVVVGTGASDLSVAAAERALGLVFPRSLREYLRRFGHLVIGHFELFGLGEGIPPFLDLVKMTQCERTESGCPVPVDLVPLLNDGGGNLYCIGTRGASTGKIYFWDHEAGPGQEPDEWAGSLEEWLGELLDETESR